MVSNCFGFEVKGWDSNWFGLDRTSSSTWSHEGERVSCCGWSGLWLWEFTDLFANWQFPIHDRRKPQLDVLESVDCFLCSWSWLRLQFPGMLYCIVNALTGCKFTIANRRKNDPRKPQPNIQRDWSVLCWDQSTNYSPCSSACLQRWVGSSTLQNKHISSRVEVEARHWIEFAFCNSRIHDPRKPHLDALESIGIDFSANFPPFQSKNQLEVSLGHWSPRRNSTWARGWVVHCQSRVMGSTLKVTIDNSRIHNPKQPRLDTREGEWAGNAKQRETWLTIPWYPRQERLWSQQVPTKMRTLSSSHSQPQSRVNLWSWIRIEFTH